MVLTLSAALVVVTLLVMLAQEWRVRRNFARWRAEAEQAIFAASPVGDADMGPGSTRDTPELVPDEELVSACLEGACVLFAGTGFAAAFGQPTWREALWLIVRRCEQQDPDPIWSRMLNEFSELEPELVADLLRTRLGEPSMHALLAEVVSSSATRDARRLQRQHDGLARVPFAGVLNAAWDDAARLIFRERQPRMLDPSSSDEFADILRRRDFFLLDTYGRLSDNSLFLTGEAFRAHLDDHVEYARFLGSLYASHTLLFVGASVAGIEDFLLGAPIRRRSDRRHFALVPWSAEAELRRDRLLERFNVCLILYEASPGHPAVTRFGAALASEARRRSRARTPTRKWNPGPLVGLRLSNVGPFDALELDFANDWTMLVGDNGSGKSTVLRAIALALAGDDDRAEAVAGRLLKTDAPFGTIELRFADDAVATRLVRDRGRVRVHPVAFTPVQAETCLALGFPPLRGVSRRTPQPSAKPPPGPAVDDLLPLLTGSVDDRLDDLKQWIVTPFLLELARRTATRPGILASGDRVPSVVKRFFSVMSALMPTSDSPERGDFPLAFARLDEETLDVLVRTPDGVVPLDLLSQGMVSVLGWIGTTIARLDEVERAGIAASELQTLVLVDEIDAHLHPRWQREIMAAIRRELPDLQILATTHSPLVVGSVGATRLWHLERQPDGVRASRVDHDYRGWRADQILTGPPFETSSRDPDTERMLEAYRQLAVLDERSPEQEAELAQVSHRLDVRMPSAAERDEARKARELIEHAARQRIDAIPPDERERVLRELQLRIQEAVTRSRSPE